jgi:hypothetical protein
MIWPPCLRAHANSVVEVAYETAKIHTGIGKITPRVYVRLKTGTKACFFRTKEHPLSTNDREGLKDTVLLGNLST